MLKIIKLIKVFKIKRKYLFCRCSCKPKIQNATLNKACFIHRMYVCSDSITCHNVNYCDAGCPKFYKCRGGSCELRETVFDEIGCNGCHEDDGWPNGVGFPCHKSGRVVRLPQQLLWDTVRDCPSGVDLCYSSGEVSGNDGR